VIYFEVKNGCNVYIILLSVLVMSLHSCLLTVFCVHYLVWCLVFGFLHIARGLAFIILYYTLLITIGGQL